jgi:hypothetical protein
MKTSLKFGNFSASSTSLSQSTACTKRQPLSTQLEQGRRYKPVVPVATFYIVYM